MGSRIKLLFKLWTLNDGHYHHVMAISASDQWEDSVDVKCLIPDQSESRAGIKSSH